PELTVTMLPGPYRIPAYRGRIRVVLTNKTPCGTYRAPGRFEGTMAREHLLDVAAGRLGLDRTELRRRNLLGPGEMPHTRAMTALGTEVVLDAADYPALLTAGGGSVQARLSRRGGPGPGRGPAARPGPGPVPGEERTGPAGDRRCHRRRDRGGQRVLRRDLVRAGHRDGDGADRGRRPGRQPRGGAGGER